MKTGKRKNKCGLCGKTGHRRQTCGKEEQPVRQHAKGSLAEDPLTEDQYDSLQDYKAQGQTSREVAGALQVSLSEVNGAWDALDYETYVENR